MCVLCVFCVCVCCIMKVGCLRGKTRLVTHDLHAYYTLYCVHMIISRLNQGSRSWSGCNRGAPAEEANFRNNWWSSCTCTATLLIQHSGSSYWIPLSMQCLTFGEGGSGDYESTWESQGTGCSYCYPNRKRYLISEHAVSWALAWQYVLPRKYIYNGSGTYY